MIKVKKGSVPFDVQQLREQTFKDRAVKAVRQKADGIGFEIGAWTE